MHLSTNDNQAGLLHWLYNASMCDLRRKIFLLLFLLGLGLLAPPSGRAQPLPAIQILTLGEDSRVMAPIYLAAVVQPGEDGLVRVALVDRQNDLLSRQVLRLNSPDQASVEFTTSLDFEFPGENIPAILTVSTQDHANRPVALRSVVLILLSSGEEMITSTSAADSWLTVSSPEPGAVIIEPPIRVVGTVTPINTNPVIIELITERGGAIISRQLAVKTAGEPMDFEVSLNFSPVTIVRDMRLVIRQPSDFVGVDAILDSLPVRIIP